MWRTQHKLAEARFFLEKLDEHYYSDLEQMLAGEPVQSVFSYYLSAFLSSARSVTWIMRSEYGKLPGWEKWFTGQQLAEPDLALLRIFNELRVRSEKVAPVKPGRHLAVQGVSKAPTERDPRLPRFRVTFTRAESSADSKPLIAGEVLEYSWTLSELEGELVSACRQYVNLLGNLVEDCASLFVAPEAGSNPAS